MKSVVGFVAVVVLGISVVVALVHVGYGTYVAALAIGLFMMREAV